MRYTVLPCNYQCWPTLSCLLICFWFVVRIHLVHHCHFMVNCCLQFMSGEINVTNSFNLCSGSNYHLCSSVCIHQKLSIPIESFSIGCDQIVASCRTFCTTSLLPFPFACSTLINTKGITSYICPSYHSYSCHS